MTPEMRAALMFTGSVLGVLALLLKDSEREEYIWKHESSL